METAYIHLQAWLGGCGRGILRGTFDLHCTQNSKYLIFRAALFLEVFLYRGPFANPSEQPRGTIKDNSWTLISLGFSGCRLSLWGYFGMELSAFWAAGLSWHTMEPFARSSHKLNLSEAKHGDSQSLV